MSAILSVDDLNDFISPGVACIKPIETLPAQDSNSNPYEVTTEDKVAAANPPPAQISLTDCLACSGCVTSAEAVLVSLQSHTEVLDTLEAHPSLVLPWETNHSAASALNGTNGVLNGTLPVHGDIENGKLFIASVSPQTRATLAATYGISERQAGFLIEQLLSGPQGLRAGGQYGSHFTWVIDTNIARDAVLVLAADEVISSMDDSVATDATIGQPFSKPKKPILTSACPGWICYAEKTHPYVLQHLSRLKSPQALTGTLLKSVLSLKYNIPPSKIWHLAIMPCFDKKLEASRTELTSASWFPADAVPDTPIRDVDCVITARELLHLATARGISISSLPLTPPPHSAFPDPVLSSFLFPSSPRRAPSQAAGPSGGYLHHIMATLGARHGPTAELRIERGRNADVLEYRLVDTRTGAEIARTARYYGFRNIQNLVRRLKPKAASRMPGAVRRAAGAGRNGVDGAAAAAAAEYAYVEVMACPGGCTNGGGQIRVGEVAEIKGDAGAESEGMVKVGEKAGPKEQREWLARVDEAYFSAESGGEEEEMEVEVNPQPSGEAMEVDREEQPVVNGNRDLDVVGGISRRHIHSILDHWASVTGVEKEKLLWTSYREVESDVGKSRSKKSDMDRVVGLASSIGGGW